MTRYRLPALLVVAAVAAGCSASDSVESTEPDPTPSTVESTTTEADSTTTAAPETTSTTTTEATTTTVEVTTTVEATTTAPAADVEFGPPPAPPATAFAVLDSDLVEIDVATGSVVRTVAEFFNADGVFRGTLRLAPDGATLWFSEGYEDGWFGCDSSVGSIGRIDLATGTVESLGLGSLAVPSPDGAVVAYRSSAQCLPDPQNPEMWVLTPYDQVVVRDLITGDERRVVTDPPPDGYGAPSEIVWLGFDSTGRLLVATFDGDVRAVDLDGPETLQEHPVVGSVLRGNLVGVVDAGWVVSEAGSEGSTDVFLADPDSGAYRLMATSEGFVTVGIADDGAVLAAGFTDVSVEPGAPVTVITPPDGGAFYDVDW